MHQNLQCNISRTSNICDSKITTFPYHTSLSDSLEFNQSLIYEPFYSQRLSPSKTSQHEQSYFKEQPRTFETTGSYSRNSYQSSRAYPATVTWLLENYETAEGVSLPRCILYYHYKQHCDEISFPPMNQASFGKLIRSVFIGLRTRRLGTRGNSKYHYYGIRIKQSSKLNKNIKEDLVKSKTNQSYRIIAKHDKGPNLPKEILMCGWNNDSNYASGNQTFVDQKLTQFSREIPKFKPISSNQKFDQFEIFEENYRSHCLKINEAFAQLNFKNISQIWRELWCSYSEYPFKNNFSNEQFREILTYDGVSAFIFNADCTLYQHLVTALIPNVLEEMPSCFIQNLRMFAKSIETQLGSVLYSAQLNGNIVGHKLNSVAAFAQILRRYTKLHHLAQSIKRIVKDSSQREIMFADISKIDILEIHEQLNLVCNCKNNFVLKIFDSFKSSIRQLSSVEAWISWLSELVDLMLSSYKPLEDNCKQILLKWSLYVSMVIRDLTLRSSLSFGSFHVMRLFLDEYLHYLVENKLSVCLDTTPVRLIAENRLNCVKSTEKRNSVQNNQLKSKSVLSNKEEKTNEADVWACFNKIK